MTPMDHADMMNRPMTTALPSHAIWFHIDSGSKPTGRRLPEGASAPIPAIAKTLFFFSCELNLR